ncbi:hypothetical protein WG68_08665 [Arsukibacterium ikkense]|uniref:Uncharacterized protein n=1 Tax=Arsukibacterium ikkense TaxID=336831 RepID=A0A0M2V9C9_9GAMM|nr:hypothetical protein [Arsukibacterium ikkense]KKO45778.1 hypothetical protein WG68_08665 [Arsukibacterium ikkense]
MNDGSLLKKIFTIGNSSSLVVETFEKNWEFGWVEHIRLSDQPSYLFNSISQNEFFSLFVTDSDMASLSLIKSVIGRLKSTNGFEVIALAETPLTSEQLGILTEIDKNLVDSNVKVVCQDSLSSILECYAHLLCGFSYTCLDFNDIHEWLHAGTTFLSAAVNIDEAVKNELPYMLYLQLTELQAQYKKLELEVAAINVVFLGEYISQDLFSASLAMISGSFSRDLNLSVHSNIHDSHQNGKVGFRMFASLKKKTPLSFDHNAIPPFLLA